MTYECLGVNIRSDTPQYTTNYRGSVTGFWNLAQDNLVTIDRHTYQFQDNASLIRGGHMIKFGGEFRRASSDRNTANLTDPQFMFDGRFAVNAFADFILGLPSRMDQGSLRVNAVRAPAYAAYMQDDWKVRPNFSITMGVRYEPLIPFYDANDRVSVFRAGQQSTTYPTAPRGLVFVGDQGVAKGGAPVDANNFGPRIGFAWSPKNKTSIRGAYGVFFETPAIHQLSAFSSTQPFSSQVQVNQPFSFSDPYRGRVNAGDGYLVLAESDAAQKRRHVAAARECYSEAMDVWKAIQSQPGFLPIHRKEMETVAAALAKLERGAL
ncbi:MAG: TonB-dependent receptor [Acidobacteria bacterium]|nr:TonB-dependent receptor [Acidobacteriota bacterium]